MQKRLSVVLVCLVGLLPTLSFARPASADTAYGTTFVVPASIEATGTLDVSDALNDWLRTGTEDGTLSAPNRIVLRGTFRVEYGLTLGNTGPSSRAHPRLPAYTRNHVVLDLRDATLLQIDATAYQRSHGVITEPRKRWGVPLLKIIGATDVEVLGGSLRSTNAGGKYSMAREPWHGVVIAGGSHIRLTDLRIANVWGDFVYITPRQGLARDVTISGGIYAHNGRQGITLNGVNGLDISGVEFRDVQRELFDHEPGAKGGLMNVDIHDTFGTSGGLGYVNLRALKATPLQNFKIRNNRLDRGHFRVAVSTPGSTRAGFVFDGNTTAETRPYKGRSPLVDLRGSGFVGVTITRNHDVGEQGRLPFRVSPTSSGVTTTPNDFVGFGSHMGD